MLSNFIINNSIQKFKFKIEETVCPTGHGHDNLNMTESGHGLLTVTISANSISSCLTKKSSLLRSLNNPEVY